jgi:hypothetical protein
VIFATRLDRSAQQERDTLRELIDDPHIIDAMLVESPR